MTRRIEEIQERLNRFREEGSPDTLEHQQDLEVLLTEIARLNNDLFDTLFQIDLVLPRGM